MAPEEITPVTRLIEQIEEMARRVGAKFVVDPTKLAAFKAARQRT